MEGDAVDLQQFAGRTFISGDCKVNVVAVTKDSVCYRIHPMEKTFYNRYISCDSFLEWLAGAVEVKGEE